MNRVQCNFRIPLALHNAVQAEAKRQDRTLSQVIRELLREWLEKSAAAEADEKESGGA